MELLGESLSPFKMMGVSLQKNINSHNPGTSKHALVGSGVRESAQMVYQNLYDRLPF